MTLAKPPAPETRCACGRLLAKLTDAGIELKCARCRRVVLIDWSAVADERSPSRAGC
jgi:phage FluMu protein Com